LKVDTGELLLFRTYEEKNKKEGWIDFGKTKEGDFYYDNRSMTYVSPNVIKVCIKIKYTTSRKKDVIQWRKENELPIVGYDKLDSHLRLEEIDCINNTEKLIKTTDYNDQGNILEDYDYQNSDINQILPESITDLLRREVCPK